MPERFRWRSPPAVSGTSSKRFSSTSISGYEDTDLGMTAIRAAGMEAVDVRDVLAASKLEI
jgi:hypothetical protein